IVGEFEVDEGLEPGAQSWCHQSASARPIPPRTACSAAKGRPGERPSRANPTGDRRLGCPPKLRQSQTIRFKFPRKMADKIPPAHDVAHGSRGRRSESLLFFYGPDPPVVHRSSDARAIPESPAFGRPKRAEC